MLYYFFVIVIGIFTQELLTINKINGFNPKENSFLKMVPCIISNTKGECSNESKRNYRIIKQRDIRK